MAAHKSRLEATFQSVQDAILTLNPEMEIIDVNNAINNYLRVETKRYHR